MSNLFANVRFLLRVWWNGRRGLLQSCPACGDPLTIRWQGAYDGSRFGDLYCESCSAPADVLLTQAGGA